jgi:uridine kinase
MSTIDRIINCIEQANHSPFVVGIDGQGGSGKSTLARHLVEQLGPSALVVQGDDFYRDMDIKDRIGLSAAEGSDQYFDWQRLREQVLLPARNGSSRLRYQRYDWNNEALGDYTEHEMPNILIVEGVYTLRKQLQDLLDLKVYVSTREPVRWQRQKDRGENKDEWIERWVAAEDYYVNSCRPQDYADIVVIGETD